LLLFFLFLSQGLTGWPRLDLNAHSSCLSLSRTEIAGMHHHDQLLCFFNSSGPKLRDGVCLCTSWTVLFYHIKQKGVEIVCVCVLRSSCFSYMQVLLVQRPQNLPTSPSFLFLPTPPFSLHHRPSRPLYNLPVPLCLPTPHL
jgi:hypothetical protein